MKPPEPSFAEIIDLVQPILGASPLAAHRMNFGDTSIVFILDVGNRHVVLRMTSNPAIYGGSERTLRALRSLGIPVPNILHLDCSQKLSPFAWMLLTAFPGNDLRYELPNMTRTQMTALASRIVAFQRRVMALPLGSGFGWVAVGTPGPFSSWWSIIQRDLAQVLPHALAVGHRELGERLSAVANQAAPLLSKLPATPFLDDVTIKNVIVKDGELSGVVDFDWICYGDPMYHPALTKAAVVADVGDKGLFYVEELTRLWPINADQFSRLAFYSALHGLDFAGSFLEEGDMASAVRMASAAQLWLKEAEVGFSS